MSIHEYLIDGTSKEKEIYLAWHTRNRSKMMKTRREFFERTSLWGSYLHEIIIPWNCFRLSQIKVSKLGCNEHFHFGRDVDWLIQPFLLGPWTTLKFEGTSHSWQVKGIEPWPILLPPYLSFHIYLTAPASAHAESLYMYIHSCCFYPQSVNNGYRHCHWYLEQQHM